MTTHGGLTGRWGGLSLVEQLGNVGSEVDRTMQAWIAGRRDRFEPALVRALELFDLTARDDRWRGYRRREILRAREEFCRLIFEEGMLPDGVNAIHEYFLQFARLARRARTRARKPGPRVLRRDASALPGAAQCWVCQQLEDEERTRDTQAVVSPAGAVAYAVCVRCGQEAPDCRDEAYQVRARRFVGTLES